MAKTTKFKSKGRGLDTIIGDAIVGHLKKMIFGDPKKKAAEAQKKAAEEKAKKAAEKKPSTRSGLTDAQVDAKIAKAIAAHMAAHAAQTSQASPKTGPKPSTEAPKPSTEAPKPASKPTPTKTDFMVSKSGVVTPTLEKGADIQVEYPSKTKEAPKAAARPYAAVDSFKKPPKADSVSGMLIHPKYKATSVFNHSAEPHVGKVKYVATFPTGKPLVQPIDDKGEHVKKPFQANPKNLTEHEV